MKRVRRPGYALMLVLMSMVVMLSLASVAYREISPILRVETVRAMRVRCDQGSLQAMAQALAVLETGTPPTNPYVAGVSLETDRGFRRFTITMSSSIADQWTVQTAPTAEDEDPPTLPSTFANEAG